MAHPSQQDPQQFADSYLSLPQSHFPHHYPYHPGFPTFPPYPPPSQYGGAGQFPPGGHAASLQPESSLHMLSQDLVTAQRRLLHYTDLTSKLYAELETIRRIVCHNCRDRISPANLASHTSAFASQSQVHIATTDSYNLGSSQTGAAPVISSHTTAGPPVAVPFSSTALSPQVNLPGPQPTPSDPTFPIPVAPHSPVVPVISNVSTPSEPLKTPLPPSKTSLADSPEDTTLIAQYVNEKPEWSVTYNGEIEQVLDVTFVHAFKHASNVEAVRFSPDGDFIAAGLSYKLGRIQIYDVKARLMKCLLEEYSGYSYKAEIPSRRIMSICYSRDGRYLVITDSFQIRIWDLANKRVLAAIKERVRSIDLSPDGRLLVTSSEQDGSIRLLTMRDGSSKLLDQTKCMFVRTVKFSPNGRYVASSYRDEFLGIWDVRLGKLVGSSNNHGEDIRSMAFSLDGEQLVSGSRDGTMKSWNVRSFEPPARLGGSAQERRKEHAMLAANEEPKFEGHSRKVCSVAISPDGKWVITGSFDKRVCIWDMQTAVRHCTLKGQKDVLEVDFTPFGNYIAIASGTEVTLWTMQDLSNDSQARRPALLTSNTSLQAELS